MKALAIFFMIACVIAPVAAQEPVTPAADERIRWILASEQIKESLESPHEALRTQTLKNAIVLATLYRDKIDMTDQVRAITAVYEQTRSSAHRKLALAALQAIGGNRAHDFLARNSTQAETDEGRLIVASVLNDYYTTRSEFVSS